jgi:hypothetical protein
MEHLNSEETPNSSAQTKHEEGENRQTLDSDDAELQKHSHSQSIKSDILYNNVNGQIASNKVNASDVVPIGEKMQIHPIMITCQNIQLSEDDRAH